MNTYTYLCVRVSLATSKWSSSQRQPRTMACRKSEIPMKSPWCTPFIPLPIPQASQASQAQQQRPNQWRLLRWNQQIRHQRRQRRRGRGLRQLLRRGLGLLAGVQHRQWWKPRGLGAWRRHGSTSGYESKCKTWGTTNLSLFLVFTIQLLGYSILTHTQVTLVVSPSHGHPWLGWVGGTPVTSESSIFAQWTGYGLWVHLRPAI